MDAAAQVIENMSSSRQIPHSLLHQAKCIAVIPNLTKAGLIVGGEHGAGVIRCRTSSGWSVPGFITMSRASIGLQAGGELKDIVLLMNHQGEEMLHTATGISALKPSPPDRPRASGRLKTQAGVKRRFSLILTQAELMQAPMLVAR